MVPDSEWRAAGENMDKRCVFWRVSDIFPIKAA
jgi:hypothetical protein